MIVKYEELTPEDKVIKGKTFLNKSHPFFARIVLNMKSEEADPAQIPTMGVSQYGRLYWNPEFVNTLTLDQLQAVLAHEAMHVATLTFQRQRYRDHELWNIATDIAINYTLVTSNMHLPDGVLLPLSAGTMNLPLANLSINVHDMCAEKIYELLEKEGEKVKENYGSFDKHILGDEDPNGDSTGDASDGEIGGSAGNQNKWKQVFTEAATYAKMRGSVHSGLERLLNKILKPKLNWKDLLNMYITRELPYNYTMARPNRRFNATGIYQPTTLKENLEIVITVDVSGSISDKEYQDFMSEVCGVCTAFEQVKARVLFWSTKIDERDDKIINRDSASELIKYKAHSTGGTTFSCVREYVERKGINSTIWITLTDGYIEHNPKIPDGQNIFVISKGGSDNVCKTLPNSVCCSLDDDGHI